ncbi:MAG: hypothetical protein J7K69_04170 [Thermotogae bacterium]|nr:hypothetical protein [Thermotogota bacterium]
MNVKRYLLLFLVTLIFLMFSVSCNIIFPNKPPEINNIDAPSEVVEGDSFQCKVTAIDDKGISYYRVKFDTTIASNTTGVFNLLAPNVQIDKTITGTVTVYDNMGYYTNENFSVLVLDSLSAPAIKILAPSDGSEIPLGDEFEISVNATNVDKVEFYFDDQKIVEKNTKPYVTTYTALSASEHTIKVIGYKGTLEVQDLINVSVVESSPPNATITVSSIVELGEQISISVDAYDENGIDYSTLTILSPTDSKIFANFSNFPQLYNFKPSILGSHHIEFRVSDHYGNETVVQRDFCATDTKAPNLFLDYPEFTDDSNVPINWTITDPSTWDGVVKINQTALSFSNKKGEFSQNATITLNDGINFLTICATDAWGHISIKTATFVVDTVDPEIKLDLPDQTFTNSLNVVYTAADEWFDYATLYVASSQIPLNEATDQNLNVDIPLIDGENLNATLVVADKAGNIRMATDNTFVDNTLYFLDATYPATTDQKSIDITINAKDKNLDENYLAINTSGNVSSYFVSKTIQVMDGKKHMEVTLSLDFTDTDSLENINIGVRDIYGNTKSLNLEIMVDNLHQPPQPLSADLYVNTQVGRIDYVLIKFHEKVVFDDTTTATLKYKTGSSVYNINNTSPMAFYGDEQTVMIEFGELIPSDVSAATVTIDGLTDQFGNVLVDPITVDQVHVINTVSGK